MEITVQYFDDCPNWRITEAHLNTLITNHALDATVTYQLIDASEAATEHGFRGSRDRQISGVGAVGMSSCW